MRAWGYDADVLAVLLFVVLVIMACVWLAVAIWEILT